MRRLPDLRIRQSGADSICTVNLILYFFRMGDTVITRVFDTEDTELYSTWHLEEGGIVCLVVPDVGEIRMSLAKAEDLSHSLKRQAEYGRFAKNKLEEHNATVLASRE